MSAPAVSVIIPTHNRLSLLRQALDSVHRQTFRDYEVIVVDDGSTESIADTAADHPVSPRVVRQAARRGPAAARNRGLAAAAAQTVAFLDSDDLWRADKLERFVRALDDDPSTRIYYGPMSPITESGLPVAGRTKPCHGGRITEKLFCSSFVHVPTVVCRKALLDAAGGFDESLPVCEDYELWLRLSVREPFGLIEEPLAMRRLHGNRLSKQCMSRNLAVKARVLERFYESHRGDGVVDPDVAAARLAKTCLAAARSAFWNGEYRRSADLCAASRRYGAGLARTAPLTIGSRVAGAFASRSNDADRRAAPIVKPVKSRGQKPPVHLAG